ncbi:MAG: hypothetical protein BWK80_22630 [Desulfobacteraceae bacterium IS3]|nr:MAG: hypothetical protein BWK80_22630 [Desulfobacteraceae bacterium IS3]
MYFRDSLFVCSFSESLVLIHLANVFHAVFRIPELSVFFVFFVIFLFIFLIRRAKALPQVCLCKNHTSDLYGAKQDFSIPESHFPPY